MKRFDNFGRIPLTLLALALIWLAITPQANAQSGDSVQRAPTATYTVNRTDDVSGLFCLNNPDGCTLRSAINLVNAAGPGFNTILIEDGLGQINLTSALPALTNANTAIINSVGNSRVVINGGGSIATGFEIEADGIYLFRLAMQGFTENYVNIHAGNATNLRMDGMALEGNCASDDAADKTAVGLNVTGASPIGNVPDVVNIISSVICGMKYGIYVFGAAETRVGYEIDNSTSGNANIMFGNRYAIHGVEACSIYTYGNSIFGNVYSGVWLRDGRDSCFNRFSNDYVVDNGNKGFVMTGSTGKAAITPREVHGNGQMGIDLGSDGWNLNDLPDDDVGPNDLYNSPELFVASGDTANIITISAYASDGIEPTRIFLYKAIGHPSESGSGGELIDTLSIPPVTPSGWIVKVDTNDYPELEAGDSVTAIAFRLNDFVTSEMSRPQSVPMTPTAVAVQHLGATSVAQSAVVVLLAIVLVGLTWGFRPKPTTLTQTD